MYDAFGGAPGLQSNAVALPCRNWLPVNVGAPLRVEIIAQLVLPVPQNLNQKVSNGVLWNKPWKMGYGSVSQVV